MTYASRTQHIRLAHQINELMQQKSLDDLDKDDYEVEEEADSEWDHCNGRGGGYITAEKCVSTTRMEPPSKTHLLPPLRMTSKFSRHKVMKYVFSILSL